MRSRPTWLMALGAAILMSGCTPPPDPSKVGGQAKAALQKQLDADHPGAHLTVQKVEVVAVDRPRYEGTATIDEGGSSFTVPVAITSDGKTTLVSVDDAKVAAGMQSSLRRRLAMIEGKYSDYILSPALFAMFPASLRSDPAEFKERLQTVVPVRADGEWLVGTGCMAHNCSAEEAAWAVNRTDGRAVAVTMRTLNGAEPGANNITFRVYGVHPENLPPPLMEWATGYGMTLGNSVGDAPEYQPPETR